MQRQRRCELHQCDEFHDSFLKLAVKHVAVAALRQIDLKSVFLLLRSYWPSSVILIASRRFLFFSCQTPQQLRG